MLFEPYLQRTTQLSRGGRDRALLDIVCTPYLHPWDAHHCMLRLEDYLIGQRDRRAIFASIYRITTHAMATAIDRGDFVDTPWVRAYLVAFANLYRRAFHDYEASRVHTVAPTWRVSFRTAIEGNNLFMQDAQLGIIAHMTRDLPFALRQVGIDLGRADKREDHNRVNRVLGAVMDDMKALMAERYATGLDAGMFKSAEVVMFVKESIGSAFDRIRERAWTGAVGMTDGNAARRALWAARIEGDSLRMSLMTLAPRLSPGLSGFLRRIEGTAPALMAPAALLEVDAASPSARRLPYALLATERLRA